MGLRYYPLIVDAYERTDEDGEPMEEVGSTEFWTQAAESFERDFGANPDPPQSVSGETSITVALSESPPLKGATEVELEENTADDEWRREWDAETLFLDDERGVGVLVQPRPGRCVLMHQDVLHRVSAPSLAARRPRYSLVLRLCLVPKEGRARERESVCRPEWGAPARFG